jgi:hypothetical protein
MTTVATTLEADGQAMGYPHATIPYPDAYAYVLALVRAQAPLRETKALASTGICEARKHGIADTRRSWHWRDDGRPVDVTILRSAA